uniref:Aldo-keto reductase n=1 Tax=Cyberlindnera americana TaxID=36016 RepID=A0A5P8N8X4_9ASCO|nr:aldo-keto reductase [Cyberlindnera americana]
MSNPIPVLALNTGAQIPQLGFGTFLASPEDCYNSTLHALQSGYRHIDTAFIYKNEGDVGRAINDSGIPRSELWVTTKCWCTTYRDVESGLDRSLANLGIDYVDLYLIHWPVTLNPANCPGGDLSTVPLKADGSRDVDMEWTFINTWEQFQRLPKEKAKNIGVSNFSIKNLEDLLKAPTTVITPAVNQVEVHPLLPQFELLQWCKSHGVVLEAYSPLGSANSSLFTNVTLLEIAAEHCSTAAQVMINWGIQRGYVVLPKSITPQRIESNFKLIQLTEKNIADINEIHKVEGIQRYIKPNWAPFPTFE